jgi:putative methyltransferase
LRLRRRYYHHGKEEEALNISMGIKVRSVSLGGRFGADLVEWADSVIRCLPEDGTNGFFVSCFVKLDPSAIQAAKETEIKSAGKRKRAPDCVAVQVDSAAKSEDIEMKSGVEAVEETKEAKEKTEAQAERARRKKLAQKKRRKVEDGPADD